MGVVWADWNASVGGMDGRWDMDSQPAGTSRPSLSVDSQDSGLLGLSRGVWAIALGLALVRLIFLAFFSPYDLVGDEAHYWEWSQRPDWSYYSKGPGVAWTILVSTWLIGSTELGVRLPAVVISLLTTLVLARLTLEVSGGSRRAALLAAALFNLAPIYQMLGLIMTIDGPLFLCWSLALWVCCRLMKNLSEGRRSSGLWLLFGLITGIGFLYKYTMLLLPLGLLPALWWSLHRGRGSTSAGGAESAAGGAVRQRAGLGVGLILASAAFSITASPVAIWNHQHDWPTVRHLAGGIGISLPEGSGGSVEHDGSAGEGRIDEQPVEGKRGGSDQPAATAGAGGASSERSEAAAENRRAWTPIYFLEFIGAQLGLIGVALLPLMLVAGWSLSGRSGGGGGASAGGAYRLLWWSGIPVVGMYVGISLFAKAQGNWAAAGYIGWIPLAAIYLDAGLARYRLLLANWRRFPKPRPKHGWLRRGPETYEQVSWHVTLGYGLVTGLAIFLPQLIAALPVFGHWVPMHRISGFAERAEVIGTIAERLEQEEQRPVLLVAAHYQQAGLVRFYLPGQPVVFSAQSLLGGRRSSYDYFPDTDLANPSLIGSNLVLIGGSPDQWRRAFMLESIERSEERSDVWIGRNFQGVRPEALADRQRW